MIGAAVAVWSAVAIFGSYELLMTIIPGAQKHQDAAAEPDTVDANPLHVGPCKSLAMSSRSRVFHQHARFPPGLTSDRHVPNGCAGTRRTQRCVNT